MFVKVILGPYFPSGVLGGASLGAVGGCQRFLWDSQRAKATGMPGHSAIARDKPSVDNGFYVL